MRISGTRDPSSVVTPANAGSWPGVRHRPVVLVRCPLALHGVGGVLMTAIIEALAEEHLAVMLSHGASRAADPQLHELPERADVCAAILVAPDEPNPVLQRLHARRYPFVVVDPQRRPPDGIAAVGVDRRAGVPLLLTHLLGLSHHRIAVLGAFPTAALEATWPAGFDAEPAVTSAGPRSVLARQPGETARQHGFRATTALLDAACPPTAVICADRETAVGSLRAIDQRGRRVPNGFRMAAVDAGTFGAPLRTDVTILQPPWAQLGTAAAAMVVAKLRGTPGEARQVQLPLQLIPGSSTQPAAVRM
jgi:LacI family transcriptional regulator